MSKNDSFFSTPVELELSKKILKNAEAELVLNRTFYRRRRWLSLLAPLAATLASFFAFKLINKSEPELQMRNPEQIELIADLIEDDEAFELMDNMSLLEDLEYIEELEVDDV